jgi:hypothetical protein
MEFTRADRLAKYRVLMKRYLRTHGVNVRNDIDTHTLELLYRVKKNEEKQLRRHSA